jgi:glycosyltransferase involved in cell wall biosynthesis
VAPSRTGAGDGELRILYHGSVVPARLPLSVLQALSALPKRVTLRVVGYETVGHIGYISRVQEYAAEHGIGARLEVVPAVPRAELLAMWCGDRDLGISLLPRESRDVNQRHMVGASNKTFDYLAAGLAVLVPDAPEWHATFVDAGYGLACDSGDWRSIAAALDWFLQHPEETRRMGERGRARVLREWNYETQFAPVVEILSKPGRGPR